MYKQLLVRNVPKEICSWIDDKRTQHNMTQQEVVLSVLDRAVEADLALQMPLFSSGPLVVEKTTPGSLPFTFIDLFAGIGGFRSALQKLGGRCLFSSEWDKYSQKTYKAWYGDTPEGDIRKIKPANIPDHDVLAAGFPCQPFSIAGVSKRQSLGMAHGFKCVTQGNLFFQLATVIKAKRPPVLFLENVKNLQSHDQGRTWTVIRETLEELGYWVFHQVIDASAWVPQHRERVYIVCFDRKVFPEKPPFMFPAKGEGTKPRLADILEPEPDPKYTLTPHLWNYLQRYAEGHRAKGNGFGFGLIDPQGISRTLSARYYKDGSEILIPQGKNKPPRRLTPRECARLMGFDEVYQNNVVVSDTQAYKQFGNAVVPKVVEAVGRQIVKVLSWKLSESGCLLKRTAANGLNGRKANA
jgi:DNA (cytosine-5)-methyltransferase 1